MKKDTRQLYKDLLVGGFGFGENGKSLAKRNSKEMIKDGEEKYGEVADVKEQSKKKEGK